MRPAAGELTADDLRQIHNLIANYAFAVDQRDAETLGGVWAREATLELIPDVAALGAPLRGRENIVEAFRAFWSGRRRTAEGPSSAAVRHICATTWIDRIEGTVAGETTMMQLSRRIAAGASSLQVTRSGTYHDRFAREDGSWVFAARRLEYDGE